jgi:hypothetical protein
MNIMFRNLLLIPLSILVHFTLLAQTPTWSEKIAPILYKNCTNCHHAGGIAPFSLLTYQEASSLSLGESTTDEMMLVYFSFIGYQTGDENIDLEAATTTTSTNDYPLSKTTLTVFPNPTQSVLNLNFNLEKADKINIQVFDYQGVMLKNIVTNQPFSQGENSYQVPVADLPKGIYWVKISSDKMYGVEGFVKGE